MKIKAKAMECQLLVKVKITSGEMIDARELDRFSRLFFRGFLKPKIVKPNVIEYTGPIGIPLSEKLRKPISKRDFLFILEQIVVAVQKLQANNLGINNLVMNPQNVYINEVTKEVQFIYIPTITGFQNLNLMQFFETIAYSITSTCDNDTEFVSRFIYYFRAMNPFDINKIESFVAKEDRSVVNTIKKQNAGQSGFMTNKQQHYYDYYDNKQQQQESNNSTDVVADDDDDATGLMVDDHAIGLITVDEPTGLLIEDDDATSLLVENEYSDYSDSPESDDDATGLLFNNDESTNFWVENKSTVKYPTLLRVLTGETISINKPVFRIGKEKSYVDYFVTNNIAVSRSHADIIARGNKYFVKDLSSKNHTYINNNMIPVQLEVEINDGDNLKLANEEFIFRV